MKKNIVISFMTVVACCFCWYNHAIAENQSPSFADKWDQIETKASQLYEEFRPYLEAEGYTVDCDTLRLSNSGTQKWDSLYWNVYLHRDTIGSQQRFERALCPQLRQAIRQVLTMENRIDNISISIFKKNGKQYCSLIPAISWSGNGYLLYRNKMLVEIQYDSKALAELVMKPDELKELPYDSFLPVVFVNPSGRIIRPITEYDGPSDYYLITGQDSLEFIGRLGGDLWYSEKDRQKLNEIFGKPSSYQSSNHKHPIQKLRETLRNPSWY